MGVGRINRSGKYIAGVMGYTMATAACNKSGFVKRVKVRLIYGSDHIKQAVR